MSELRNDQMPDPTPAPPPAETPRKTTQERLKEITANIERGIQELFSSDKYRQYLATMSRFHRYSVNNQMLIYMQRPDATLVAGYGKWQKQFERHVNRGEKGITIIAPAPYKKKVEQIMRDPDTRLPLKAPDGSFMTEEVEKTIPHFRPTTVFDVSQTDGKPLPEIVSPLTAAVQNYDVMMEALRRSSPVPISIEPIHDGSDGFFSHTEQRIAIKEGMSESQTVSTAIHEIAHARLHRRPDVQFDHDAPRYQLAELAGQEVLFSNGRIDRETLPEGLYCYELREGDSGYAATIEASVTVNHFGSVITTQPIQIPEHGFVELNDDNGLSFSNGGEMTIFEFVQHTTKDRRTKEVEAESVAYAVCQYYGIETAENSFGYIAHWSQSRDLPELRASLETINKTSADLINDIDRHLQELCRERGIALDTETMELPPHERLYLVDEIRFIHVQESDSGYGYTIYDAASGKQLDGGQIDNPNLTPQAVIDEICALHDLGDVSIQPADPQLLIGMKDSDLATLIEQRFLAESTDSYAIYQLRPTEETDQHRFAAFSQLQKQGLTVDRNLYELVHTGPVLQGGGFKETPEILNDLFFRFNHNHPEGFIGHSLSVSDVIAVRNNGELGCFYVDRWGFEPLPGFLDQQNPLRTAELSTEDDLNMIDGIINNGKAHDNEDKEQKKPSVREKLKQPKQTHTPKKNMPRKAERDI